MDRARKNEPRSNKLLYEAELRFRKETHDRKIRSVKASVDNSAPKGFGVAKRNLKKEMNLEEHYSKIEHQNRLLLSRMSDIMTRPVGGGAAPGAGGVDNVCLAWEYGRSLNSRNRKAEIERINAANRREHENIRKVEPMYNHVEWDEHAAVAEKLAFQLTEFQRLPIGAEKRGSLNPLTSPQRSLSSSFLGGSSGGAGLSMSRLGSSGHMQKQQQQQQHFGGSGMVVGDGGFSGSGVFSGGSSQLQQGGSVASLPGGMALNPSSSFIGGGGLAGSSAAAASSSSSSSSSQYQLPGLGSSQSVGYGMSSQSGGYGMSSQSGGYGMGSSAAPPGSAAGLSRAGLATPGGTTLGSLAPSAAALLAKYGYSSVLGGGGVPPGGAAVPTVLGGASGSYPTVVRQ